MMKLKPLIHALAFLLWIQNSRAELTIEIDKHLDSPKSSVYHSVEKIAADYWFMEEQAWKVIPRNQTVTIDYSLVSGEHWAQTRENKINLNVYTPSDDIESVIKHELSHVFLNSHCPSLSDKFTHELFAYWRSSDYRRILYKQSQIFSKSHAISKIQSKSKFDHSNEIAIARIINELVNKGDSGILMSWFQDLIRNCNSSEFLKTQSVLQEKFLEKIKTEDYKISESKESGFLIFDGVANEVIEAGGHWEKPRTVGSILKPMLSGFFSDLKKSKNKRKISEWECGEKTDLNWDFKKALNYSCNGFFLDSKYKPAELENYVRTFNSITGSSLSSRWLAPADLIGLWPAIKLNLLEVARLYDFIAEKNPNTISILEKTAALGTLAESSESKWFLDNQIALKSGTTTRMDLSIDAGYLVAVFNTATAKKIAVLFRSGSRPIDLLGELKSKIAKHVKYKDSIATVQVLSAFNQKSLEIVCPTLILNNGIPSANLNVNLSNTDIYSDRYSCVGSPFEVRSPDNVSRRLYGELTFQKIQPKPLIASGRSEKNMRAQVGSSIILNTSKAHYIKNVFFSESGSHRQELKKALLLIIKNNLEFWNRKKQAICDTTICQVFNLNYDQVTALQKKSVSDMIIDLGDRRLGSLNWLEFSVGGTQNWEQVVDQKKISEALEGVTESQLSGKRLQDEFHFSTNDGVKFKRTCEWLRGRFKLRSCPLTLHKADTERYVFYGQGEGHERGMNLIEAEQMAVQGYSFDQIIELFYGEKVL